MATTRATKPSKSAKPAKRRSERRAVTGLLAELNAKKHANILDLVREKLAETNNRAQIARELGMDRTTLYHYLRELGVVGLEPVLVIDEDGNVTSAVRRSE